MMEYFCMIGKVNVCNEATSYIEESWLLPDENTRILKYQGLSGLVLVDAGPNPVQQILNH